ncbi:transposase [Eilatimonas milleporae]|uniref:Transposase n=1 Tax=Eilatimonas milleporae TaxID=911205 RepID=A0A3M0CDI9_9PROT|nr:transposase [Eilatimonas milleporae]
MLPTVKGGGRAQTISRSRGGRTTKIHALSDADCRPVTFLLTPGNMADCTAAEALIEQMTATGLLHADKSYDSDRLRRQIETCGVAPNIPPKRNRRWKSSFSPFLYRDRNAIERMFSRLMNFRRIATRYEKLAQNFLTALQLTATVCYWL